jgi:flagellar motor switch/type III secretory pathway protein FliN
MAAPNQTTEAENAAHPSGVPVDPFAVDFFGGAAPPPADEEEFPSTKIFKSARRLKPAKKSDWHKHLPQISNAEAEFSNLLSGLPENLTENAARAVAETLGRYTFQRAEKVFCSLTSVYEVNLNQALEKLNESPKIFLTIGVGAENSRAVAALNVDFAATLIDSMLDGQGAPRGGNRRELSPVETTIIEFLAANVLREINNFAGEPLLYLENVKPETKNPFESFERGAEVILSLETGAFKGIISLYAPPKFLKFLDKSQNPLFIKKAGRKKLRDFEKLALHLDLRLHIGTTFLDADSLLFLEPDDIVLIEQSQIGLEGGSFSRNFDVLIGRGGNFRFRGIVKDNNSDGDLNFKIEEILSEEARRALAPTKFKMDEKVTDLAEESDFETDAPAAENTVEEILDEQISPSLENIQVALRIEIAGSKISLRELQNLRAGQIIALGCSPTDPVRLVTDNTEEPVATGELVEIEGQLGVRLTKVFI